MSKRTKILGVITLLSLAGSTLWKYRFDEHIRAIANASSGAPISLPGGSVEWIPAHTRVEPPLALKLLIVLFMAAVVSTAISMFVDFRQRRRVSGQ